MIADNLSRVSTNIHIDVKPHSICGLIRAGEVDVLHACTKNSMPMSSRTPVEKGVSAVPRSFMNLS